jgi:acyl transferase domain-containing protein
MDGRRPIALLLPGQGAQHQGMATALYGREAVFTAVLDEFFELLGGEGGRLRADWLAERPGTPLDDASRAQPLLFAIGVALGRTLHSRGIRPGVLLGHSVGELAAAALAGVFDLPSAARVMAARSAVMATAPAGGMLAVAARPDALGAFTGPADQPGSVVVGAVNAPMQTVLAGPEPALAATERALAASGLAARRVPSLQPFHCPAVAPQAARFQEAFAAEPLHPTAVPVLSTRTTREVTAEQARNPEFWAGQLARPVLFWPTLERLLAQGDFTLVEAGPGQGLSMSARRHPAVRSGRCAVVPLLPAKAEGSWEFWQAALERLESLAVVSAPVSAAPVSAAPEPAGH